MPERPGLFNIGNYANLPAMPITPEGFKKPKHEGLAKTTITVPSTVTKQLRAFARRRGVTISSVVAVAITELLERQAKADNTT